MEGEYEKLPVISWSDINKVFANAKKTSKLYISVNKKKQKEGNMMNYNSLKSSVFNLDS